jgi:hypothetical protein
MIYINVIFAVCNAYYLNVSLDKYVLVRIRTGDMEEINVTVMKQSVKEVRSSQMDM